MIGNDRHWAETCVGRPKETGAYDGCDAQPIQSHEVTEREAEPR